MFVSKFVSPSGLVISLYLCLSLLVFQFTQIRSALSLITLMGLLSYSLMKKKVPLLQGSLQPKSINSSLPKVQWLPIRIPIVEGLITVFKIRTVGLKLCTQLSEQYGPSLNIDFGLRSVVLTSDPELIKAILSSTNEHHMNKPGYFYDTLLTTALKDGLFGASHKTWLKHRRAVFPSFSYKSLITYLEFINENSQNLLEQLLKHTEKDAVIQNSLMKSELDKFAVTTISQIILGDDKLILTEAERDQYKDAFCRFKNSTVERFTNPEQMLPFVWAFHPNKQKMDRAIGEMSKHIKKIIFSYISKDIVKANANNDVTNFSMDAPTDSEYYASLEHVEKSAGGSEVGVKPFQCLLEHLIKASLSSKEIIDEVTTFMAAGHETLTTTMDMLLFNLAYNREAQLKCQKEVDDFFHEHFPGGPETAWFTMENLGHLKYLERCVLESMRLTPTLPLILRSLEKPLPVKKDSYFEGGQTVCVNIWEAHRNPNIYPNPEKFDPDRFLPEDVKARHSHAFLPFSFGSRNCIGWKLALMETKIILARLVSNFEFWTTDEPKDVKLDFHITIKPERIHNVYFRRRHAE